MYDLSSIQFGEVCFVAQDKLNLGLFSVGA